MVSFTNVPVVDKNIAIIGLVLNLIFPGAGNIVCGLSAKPQHQDSITTGIIAICMYIVVPVIAYVVLAFLSAFTFGLALLLVPFIFIFNIVAWIYGIFWSVKCIQASQDSSQMGYMNPMNVHQQPQQPYQQQPYQQQPYQQQPQQPYQQQPMVQQPQSYQQQDSYQQTDQYVQQNPTETNQGGYSTL